MTFNPFVPGTFWEIDGHRYMVVAGSCACGGHLVSVDRDRGRDVSDPPPGLLACRAAAPGAHCCGGVLMSWPTEAAAAIRRGRVELDDLGFDRSDVENASTATCRACGCLVPYNGAVPDLTAARKHRAWDEAIAGTAGGAA